MYMALEHPGRGRAAGDHGARRAGRSGARGEQWRDATGGQAYTYCMSRRNFLGGMQLCVVVKYMGDTFLDLSCEKLPGHPHKRGSSIPLEGPQRKCLSAGRVESVAV